MSDGEGKKQGRYVVVRHRDARAASIEAKLNEMDEIGFEFVQGWPVVLKRDSGQRIVTTLVFAERKECNWDTNVHVPLSEGAEADHGDSIITKGLSEPDLESITFDYDPLLSGGLDR